ncbi:hypothetical protein ACO0SA_003614 [Hanseniaspora valbyensis]
MGQKLSILAQTTPYIDISSYINIIQDLQFIKNLNNNSKFISTNKCISIDNKDDEIIAKVFIKPEQFENNNIDKSSTNDPLNINLIVQSLLDERERLKEVNNVIHYPHILNLSRATYLFRPYILQTLNDRISPHNNTNNRLELIEVKFFIFQILKTLSEIHKAGVIHGNITPRNIFITAMDKVVFSDFSFFLKPFYLPEDNPNEYDFYFGRTSDNVDSLNTYSSSDQTKSTANGDVEMKKIKEVSGIKVNIKKGTKGRIGYTAMKGFYLAPERLDNNKRNANQQNSFNEHINLLNNGSYKCDIFSVGCVIFELLSMLQNNGQKLFTFQEIFKYKNDDFSIIENKIKFLDDVDSFSSDLIRDCCGLNPDDRLSCEELLTKYKGSFFPKFFYTDFYGDIIECLTDFEKLEFKFQSFCDDLEAKCDCIGFPVIKKYDNQHEDQVFANYDFIKFSNDTDLILLQKYKDLNHEQNECIKTNSAIIYINTFGKLLKIFDSIKDILLCLDCLLIMSQYCPDTVKLDVVLPYLMSFLINCNDSVCKSYALNKTVQLCSTIDKENIEICSDTLCYYVFPLLNKTLNKTNFDTNNRMTLIDVLPKLIKYTNASNKSLKKNVFSIISILLIEDDIDCKINLLEKLPNLVMFLGKTVTNDLILSHLITYLNESSLRLRIALINCLCKISPFLGQISFQEFIYPLLIQNLYLLPDQKDLIFTVLRNLHELIIDDSNFIVNKKVIKFKTLIEDHLVHFLLLPNQVLKKAAIQLLKDIIIDKSDLSELYCLYYPLIKPYYHMNMEINAQLLEINCRQSITEEQLKYLFIWGIKHDYRNSLFWKERVNSAGNSVEFQYNNYVNPDEMNEFLSMEDKLFIDQFVKKYKLDLYQIWKLAKLRKYIKKLIKNVSLNLKNEYMESDSSKNTDNNNVNILTDDMVIDLGEKLKVNSLEYSITYMNPENGSFGRRKSSSSKRKDSSKLISQKLLNDALRSINESSLEEVSTNGNGKINSNNTININNTNFVDFLKTSYAVEKTIAKTADANVLNYIESINIKPEISKLNEISFDGDNDDEKNIVAPVNVFQKVSTLSNFERICEYGDRIDKIIANDKYIAVTTINENEKYILLYDIYNFDIMNITNHNQYMRKIDVSLYTQNDNKSSKIHDFKFWNDDILIISFDNGLIVLLKILEDLTFAVLKKNKLNGNNEYGHIINCSADRIFILTSFNRMFEYDYIENQLSILFTWSSKILEDAYDNNKYDKYLEQDIAFEVITDFVEKDNIVILITSMNNVYVYDLEFMILRNLYQLYRHRNMNSDSYLPLRSISVHGSENLVMTGGYDISVLLIFNINDLISWNEEETVAKSNIISATKVILNSDYKNFTIDDDLYDKFILRKYETDTTYDKYNLNESSIENKCFYNFVNNDSDLIAFYDSHSNDVSCIDLAKNSGEVLFTNNGDSSSNIAYKKYNLNNYLKLYYRSGDSVNASDLNINNNIRYNNIILTRYIHIETDMPVLILATLDGYIYCYSQDI